MTVVAPVSPQIKSKCGSQQKPNEGTERLTICNLVSLPFL